MTQKKHDNSRIEGEPTEKTCTRCKKSLPIEDFGVFFRMLKNGEERRYRLPRCRKCLRDKEREKYASYLLTKPPKTEEKPQKKIVTCRENCEFYPCFKGIDTMSSNLALTCMNFKERKQ